MNSFISLNFSTKNIYLQKFFKEKLSMEEELGIDNILGQEDIENLFASEEEDNNEKQDTSEQKEDKTTEEVTTDELFEEAPESVGSDEHQGSESTDSDSAGTSPENNNFYASIAKALQEDGVFTDLDDSAIDKIKSAEDFAVAIENQLQAKLDEKQKRIEDALNANVEDNVIRQYENTINYLENIKEEDLTAEDDAGENLRKQLIYQDMINKGYSKEDAVDELKDIFDSGNDVKKAKRALTGNLNFFKNNYQKVIDDAKKEVQKEEEERKTQTEKLKKSILEDKDFFGDLQVDKATRQKIFNNISKPVYKDKDGELYTAIQKYEMENKTEFLKNIGLIFTLTDGFKNMEGLIKGKVNKEVKKNIRELERTLSNTTRTSDGNLRFVTGVSDDNSFIGKGWDVDI